MSSGEKIFAYSGDTQWTDALLPIAAGADLFIVECYEYERELTGHMNWKTIKQRLADFGARRVGVLGGAARRLGRSQQQRRQRAAYRGAQKYLTHACFELRL